MGYGRDRRKRKAHPTLTEKGEEISAFIIIGCCYVGLVLLLLLLVYLGVR